MANSRCQRHRHRPPGPWLPCPYHTRHIPRRRVSAGLPEAFGQITADWRSLPISLVGIGVFPGESSILWAAPVVTADLLSLHAAVADSLPNLPIHPHYRRNAWVAHVTLTGALSDPGAALAALLPLWRPMTGCLFQADIVRFRPVEVLQSRTLPS